ncbi:hypothetical protein BH24ACT5_BH24ACT5_04900 [soil metagenome]
MTPSPSPTDLPGVETIAAGTPLYRLHRTTNNPAFFDTSGHGRFNPPETLTSRFGTLYLAREPAGAFIETLGRIRYLRPDDIAQRRLTTVTFARAVTGFAVDAASNRFYGDFDLAAEAVSTCANYTRPQQLAAVLRDEAFDAITYPARHDNSATLRSVAVFGPSGSHSPDDVFTKWTSEPVASALIEEMVARYGFELVDDAPLP